ncbi:MAG: HAMP domain-containing sensor histidine kinase, partial [candidate division KSB1 bacterium]
MFRLRIRTLLVLFLILQVSLVLALAGFYLQWQMRRQLEAELAQRLLGSARTAAHIVETAVGASAVVSLLPGDEEARAVKSLQRWLMPLAQSGGLARVLLCDRERRIYFDSQKELPLGSEYIRLRFDENEINSAWQGEALAAKLFLAANEQPFKAAYAPLYEGGRVAALVVVEGSAAALEAVEETRKVLWSLALVSLLAATLSGVIFARRITAPLEQLRRAAIAIGSGSGVVDLQLKGTEEIRFLAATMEHMREAITQREQNLRLMLAGVAHEIRNPLGGIELHAGLLEKDVPADLKARVQTVRLEVRRLENIVRDFLDYAKPRASEAQRVEVRALMEDLREHLQPQFPRIAWQIEIHEHLAARVDAEQLRRMLLNLMRNAIEAMNSAGTVQVRLIDAGNNVKIQVRDNGKGIPPEILPTLTQRGSTHDKEKGSGLGLYHARTTV